MAIAIDYVDQIASFFWSYTTNQSGSWKEMIKRLAITLTITVDLFFRIWLLEPNINHLLQKSNFIIIFRRIGNSRIQPKNQQVIHKRWVDSNQNDFTPKDNCHQLILHPGQLINSTEFIHHTQERKFRVYPKAGSKRSMNSEEKKIPDLMQGYKNQIQQLDLSTKSIKRKNLRLISILR